MPPVGRRLHAGCHRQGPAGRGRRSSTQFTFGARRRRRGDVPRQRRGRLHRVHPAGGRTRPGPGRGDLARSLCDHVVRWAIRRRQALSRWLGPGCRREGRLRLLHAKEIQEQPRAVADTLRGHLAGGQIVLDEQRVDRQDFRDVDKVFVVACGTAYHSGLIAKHAIEHWTRVPVEVEMASEFRYRDPVLDRQTLVVAISQSGETADTLEAVRHARSQRAKVLSICNTNGAQIPRESDAVLYTHAGPEIGVAATKTFTAQIAAVSLVGLALAQARGTKYGDEISREYAALAGMPELMAQTLGIVEPVRELAREIAPAKAVLFLGRGVGYPVALEGALKLKELAYMHAEGFPAGELKHGPIALIEDGLPVVIVMPSPTGRHELHRKMLSNIAEIRARGARTIVIAELGDEAARAHATHLIEVPATPSLFAPLVTTIPLQVLAAEIAQARGYDVDKPRNLAKSVTVE
ncbi:MAG TPA: glutamine--fructose-6-phosphate transaminase (isomerizing) [Jatrophihabitantaceae bacterium]|nr:glutamine--fructose-6-phosphate transaminase (isomerizing) [Jatrophihabitantaceae bacterium]